MIIKKPKLKGDIKDQIAAQFDLVGYIEKSYVAENGQRVLKRQIRWHSEPRYPMAKDRSGRLPRFTDIDFTEGDFERIFEAIVGEHVDMLPESTLVESLVNGDVDPAPPDLQGGPVAVQPIQLPRAAKKTAAKKTATKKAEPKPEPAPAAEKQDDTPVKTEIVEQSIEVTEPEAKQTTEEQGVANVAEQLGATPVEDPDAVDPTVPTAPAAAASAAPVESSGGALVCGDQPAHFKKFDGVKGCGKSLAEENRDLINIAMLRTKTYLCAACSAAHKAGR